jgi:iron complex outermembrane receptor protein
MRTNSPYDLWPRNRRRRFPGWLAGAVGGVLAATVLPAQPQTAMLNASQLKRMSVEELLQQEVVSVSRRGEALGAAAGNVYYIAPGADLGSGANTLPQLLRMAPSLFVAQLSASDWGVNARGFMRANGASNKLLVLIDGRTAYLPLYSNVFWDTTEVFLPDLDSIEVISGPSGSNWGSNAVNGVINIRSKSAHETLGGLVNLSAGTNGSQVAARQGFRVGETGAVRIHAQHTEREATYSPTGADDDSDTWRSTQAGFRADWGKKNGDTWTAQGSWQTGKYNARPAAPVLNDAGHLLVRWSRDLSPGSTVWVRAFYDYVLRNTNDSLTEETRTADVEFQHTLAIGSRQQFLWGLNYRRIHDEARDSVGLVILPRDIWLDLGAVFSQHDVTWHDGALRLTSGLRFEHNDFTGWEYQPTLRLAWRKGTHTTWVAASRAVRTPSRIEKGFFAPAEPPYFIAGGPNFVSEIINSYELGWRGQLTKGVSLTATVYHHRYDNLRSVEFTTPIVQANGTEGESYGLELFMDYDVTPTWRLRSGGFVMNQKTWNKPGSLDLEGGLGEGSFPGHQVFLRNNFRLTPKVDLWLSLRHVAEVPAYEYGGGVVPAYTELDARLGWQVRPGLNVALVGRNLLDASHPEIGGLDRRREIRRSVAASLRWEF